ncbi:hypothetical protein ACFL2T_02380 [Elusimicrobiota bacterium]
MRWRYIISRVSPGNRRKATLIAKVLAIPVIGPGLVASLQASFSPGSSWMSNGLLGGPYLIVSAVFLFCLGVIVGDDTAEASENPEYESTLESTTRPFGIMSQIMLVCQIAPPFMVIGGVIWFIVSLGR